MMTNTQYLLTKLAEECSEVSQMALKCQHFGLNEVQTGLSLTNKQRLHDEINDILGIISMLNTECGFEFNENPVAIIQKSEKVSKYRDYSKSIGLVEDENKNQPSEMFNKILDKVKEQLDSMTLPVEKKRVHKKPVDSHMTSFEQRLDIIQKSLPDLDLNIVGKEIWTKVNGVTRRMRFASKQTNKGYSAWSIKGAQPGEVMVMVMLDNNKLRSLTVVQEDLISKSGSVWISEGSARDVAIKINTNRVIKSLS